MANARGRLGARATNLPYDAGVRRPSAALLAAAWSLGYGALGLGWALGAGGFPFGVQHDPEARLSLLSGATADATAPIIAALGLVGAIVGLAMARRWAGVWRRPLLAFAWAAATALALLIPDYRVLVLVAYAPIVLIGSLFGWPPGGANLADAAPWPVVNQFLCIGGGLAWAAAAVSYGRLTRGACASCGRSESAAEWTRPEAAARWGRWAVGVAVLVPILYAVTRWAWALGMPLGITEEFLREGQASGLWLAGAALATLAVVGALLTLGLVQRWGEEFPGWWPIIGGRRVPPAVAVVPAAAVAVLVTAAGLMFVRLTLAGGFAFDENTTFTLTDNWAALAPELLWPIWGIALGAATLAYHYRRRGTCRACGRG